MATEQDASYSLKMKTDIADSAYSHADDQLYVHSGVYTARDTVTLNENHFTKEGMYHFSLIAATVLDNAA